MKYWIIYITLAIASAIGADLDWQSSMGSGSYESAVRILSDKIVGENTEPAAKIEWHLQRALAYLRLGWPRKAFDDLSVAWELNSELQDDTVQCRMCILLSDFYLAENMLMESLKYGEMAANGADQLQSLRLQAAAWNAVGNVQAALYNSKEAVEAYRKSLDYSTKAGHWYGKCLAMINFLKVSSSEKFDESEAGALFKEVCKKTSGYQQNLLLVSLGECFESNNSYDGAAKCFQKVISEYKLGKVKSTDSLYIQCIYHLARLKMAKENFQMAAELLAPVILEGKADNFKELNFRIHWLYAKILEQRKKYSEALSFYRQATELLNACRDSIFSGRAKLNTDFNSEIRPVFYDYARLLVKMAESSNDEQTRKEWLHKLVSELETLKMAEFHNYFDDQYTLTYLNRSLSLDKMLDDKTAVVYTLSWPEKSAFLVITKAGWELVNIDRRASDLSKDIIALRVLVSCQSLHFKSKSIEFYNRYIKPLNKALENIDQLVIVPDSHFQLLPFDMLSDGGSYLAEKFKISYSPGMWLFNSTKAKLKDVNVLTAGLTESLPGVSKEVDFIASKFKTDIVTENEFTGEHLQKVLKENYYQIIHLGTHAEFTGDHQGNNVKTANGRLSLNDLEDWIRTGSLRRKGIELLSLGACQTALGNEEATLGLSGVAIRSGARAVLGSLWKVDDKASSMLMKSFYENLSNGYSKSEALKMAKITLSEKTEYSHPYFWAPFILIGNWY